MGKADGDGGLKWWAPPVSAVGFLIRQTAHGTNALVWIDTKDRLGLVMRDLTNRQTVKPRSDCAWSWSWCMVEDEAIDALEKR